MRKNIVRLGLATLALVASLAIAAGIPLNPASRVEFTDCASGGSAAQTLVAGSTYLFRVTDAGTFICLANSGSTCASGGEKFPVGTVMLLTITGDTKSISCRSSASTGDAIFTNANL